jgi:hypothetical protein
MIKSFQSFKPSDLAAMPVELVLNVCNDLNVWNYWNPRFIHAVG